MSEPTELMSQSDIADYIASMPDEVAMQVALSMPFRMDHGDMRDEDNFRLQPYGNKDYLSWDFTRLQAECWRKFNSNPLISSSVRDYVGRIFGKGFEVSSSVVAIQDKIEEITNDRRNRLRTFYPKWGARKAVEGELFIAATVHEDGFVEMDFIDPSTISGCGQDNCGIIFHPLKANFPLFYKRNMVDGNGRSYQDMIPSINMAYYPDMIKDARGCQDFQEALSVPHRSSNPCYTALGGYFRFVIAWDSGYMTRRNLSSLRCILEWCNYYEMLKKYEIDHKRSSGSFLWVVEFENPGAFKNWMSLSKEDKNETGILAKPTPGGKVIMPPGMKLRAENPNLPKISDQDTDIMHMVTAGLNQPEDMVTGQAKGTNASVTASRPPQADRMTDEHSYTEQFIGYELWGGVLFLISKVDASFALEYEVNEVIDFNEKQEPVWRKKKRRAEELIDVVFPVSELSGLSERVGALLGVKHGSLNATLGIPNEVLSSRLGFGGYRRMRLKAAAEEKKLPPLQPEVDQESATQESAQEKIKGGGEAKKTATQKPAAQKPATQKLPVRTK